MVAFSSSFTPAKSRSRSKNRAGDFFWPVGDRAGSDRSATGTASGKNERFVYDACRGAALPQQVDPDDKWSDEDCAGYKAMLDLKYDIFNDASDALREDLKFQYDSALTLYMVDRAVDTATSLAAGQLFKAGQALRSAQASAQASASIHPALSGPGVSSIFSGPVTLTNTGQALSYATPVGLWVGEQATGYAMSQPFAWGTDAVRNDIQNLIDDSDAFVEGLARDLSGMRETYKENCQ